MRTRPRYGVAAGLLATALLPGCGSPKSEPPPLTVEYAGCQTVLHGPVCVLPDDGRLRLWVDAPPEVEIELSARTVDSVDVQGGRRLLLAVDDAAPELQVSATGPGGTSSWSLALRPDDEPPWLARASALRAGGDLAGAMRVLEASLAAETSVARRGRGLQLLAKIAQQAGEVEAARRWMRQAIDASRAAGRFLEEIESRTALFYWLYFDRHKAAARELLDGAPAASRPPAEASIYLAYYGGYLAGDTGDLRTGLRLLDDAARRAERLGLVGLERAAHQVLSLQLPQVGRHREAVELLTRRRALDKDDSGPCERAQLANNIGWNHVLAHEAGHRDAGDPLPWLEEALEHLERDCPELTSEPINVHTNLALAHLHAGRRPRARQHLEHARRLAARPELRQLVWWRDIEARLELDAGRPGRALELYDDMARLAAAALSPEAEWRAAVGRGRAHSALGQPQLARADFAAAEALVDGASLMIAAVGDRASFVAVRESGTRLYLELLLGQGRARDAFEVARRARTRVLQGFERGERRLSRLSPDERRRWDEAILEYQQRRTALDAAGAESWRLPADELRRIELQRQADGRELRQLLDRALGVLEPRGQSAPGPPPLAPGEIRLLFHPLPEGWVGFAEDAGGVMAERLGELPGALPPAELGRRLLAPFATRIERSRRVRILPYGRLRAVDFHALPFAGDPLLASRPVVYGLDLEPRTPATGDGQRWALIVADPTGDLAAAPAEASRVQDALERLPEPWTIDLLTGAAASGDAVRRALPRADLFHFAGHGVFAGWDSALPLASDSRLTVGDILALARVPERVVLSGCDTGRADAGVPVVDAAGLAQAFLTAGSRSVVAATRPVDDDVAAALIDALYPALRAADDVPEALRRAQLELRRRRPGADWSSFRAFEP